MTVNILDSLVHSRLVQVARIPLSALLVCMLVMLAATRVMADPLARPANADAVACLLRGNRLYAVREFDKAIEQYKAGALLEDAPVFQYNLAQAYRVTGRYEDALWHYERFVRRTNPTGELRQTVDGFMAQMRQEIERAAMKQQPTAVAPQGAAAQPVTSVRPSSKQSTHWYQDRVGWSLTATGAVLMSVGIYLLIDARTIDERALDESRDAQRADLRASATARRTAGYALGALGVASVGTGSVRLALHSDRDSASATIAFAGRF